MESIRSKSLKKLGVKFNDLFLLIEWLRRDFIYFVEILPLDFAKTFNICSIRVFFPLFRAFKTKFSKNCNTVTISKLFDAARNNFQENHSLWTSKILYKQTSVSFMVYDLEIS